MNAYKPTLLFGLPFLLFITIPSWGVALPREGGGDQNYYYYSCSNIHLGEEGAGGKPLFKIELKGVCAVHYSGDLKGWTPVDWKQVTVRGDYNADSGIANETIWAGPVPMVSAKLNCKKNPWVHGPWVGGQTCTPTGNVTNKTGAKLLSPLPLSAGYIPGSMRVSLMNWEKSQTPEEILADWNPLPQTGGASAMKIVNPTAYENIASNTDYLYVTLKKNPNFQEPSRIRMEIERLEEAPKIIGDIALPSDKTHWWQPLHSADWSYSVFPFPLPISSGLIAGKEGYYKLRVRAMTAVSGEKSKPIGGWTPWRSFCVGAGPGCTTMKKLIKVADKTQKLISVEFAKQFSKQGQQKKTMKAKTGFGTKAIASRKLKSGQAKTATLAKTGKLKLGGNITPLSSQSPTGIGSRSAQTKLNPGAARMAKTPTRVAKVKTNVLRLKIAKLKVNTTSYSPAPLKAGKAITFGITFKNSGLAASQANAQYKLSCKVIQGPGPCPVAVGTFQIGKVINKGSQGGVVLISAKTAVAGKYKVSVAVPPNQVGRLYSTTLKVAANKVIIKRGVTPVLTPTPDKAAEKKVLKKMPRIRLQ